MVQKNYHYQSTEIQSGIENVARVFKGYKLQEKLTAENFNRCWNELIYHDYKISGDENGSVLSVKSGKAGKKLSESESDHNSEVFVSQLNKILNKEIVITPEIANVNPYKPVSSGNLLYSLIVLAIAVYGIYWAIKAFFL
jgi:hypothetical protein